MQPTPLFRIRASLLLLSGMLSFNQLFSQNQLSSKIQLDTDTISNDAAVKSQAKFKNDQNNSGRKATTLVTMDVAKLKDLVDQLSANGVTDVSFLIVTIRREDTAQYSKRNPGLTNALRNDLIGRQQLVIRVPRAAMTNAVQMGFKNKNNKPIHLIASMMLMGLMPLEYSYYELTGSEDLFLAIGSICPPPASCMN